MEMVSVVFGGIGLFLLGMTLMTDGLKALAGDSLKQLLSKFTGGSFSSILSGAVITAIIQSSSATTLMTIGFVSAGLLSFSQSIGVIIGANLGSTSTGWIVSFIGFKVNMGLLASPLIGIGAILKFFSKGKYSPHGMAIAGFGLIFFGIDVLQTGMSGVTENFHLESVGHPTFLQMLLLVVVGIAMTIIMQSSSAAIVITLSALAVGAISFEQAATLVIGQNVGTTFKAFIASIGGSIPAKRTALAHIVFNLFTGLIAFIFLPFISSFIFWLLKLFQSEDMAIALAVFNTFIYIIGVLLFVPFLSYFTKLIGKFIPDRSDKLTKYLDPSVATIPPVAIEAVRRTLIKVAKVIAAVGAELYSTKQMSAKMKEKLEEANIALSEARRFLSQISDEPLATTKYDYQRQVSLIHVIDHLHRMLKAFEEQEAVSYCYKDKEINVLADKMKELLSSVEGNLSYEDIAGLVEKAEANSITIADMRRKGRKSIIETTVLSQADVDDAIQTVHTIHWIDRIAYHLWRAMYHLQRCQDDTLEDE